MGRPRADSQELVVYNPREATWRRRLEALVFGGQNGAARNEASACGGGRARAESNEIVLYDPSLMARINHLVFGGILTLFSPGEPALLEDNVPTLVSYFDSASLLAAGVVSRHWHSIATADQFWRVIVREDYSLDPACIDPPPRPVKALWLKMRRAFRSLLASDAAPPPACAQPLPVLPDRIVVH